MSSNLNDTKNKKSNVQIQTNSSMQKNSNANRNNNIPAGNNGENTQMQAGDLDLGEFVTVTKDMCIDYTKRDEVYRNAETQLERTRSILTQLKDMGTVLFNHKAIEELYDKYMNKENSEKEKGSGNKLSFASYKDLVAYTGEISEELTGMMNLAMYKLKEDFNGDTDPLYMVKRLQELKKQLAKSAEDNLKEFDRVPTEQILDVKEDQEEDKARENMVALGNMLDSQMSVIETQLKGECSDLFKSCCNSVKEFRYFLKSGKLDVAKEHDFMPRLLKMRSAVAAYYEKNKGTKFTPHGRKRRDMAKAILGSIENFISGAPEYILQKFSEDENAVNEKSSAGIKAVLGFDNLPTEFKYKYRGDLNKIFGNLIKNHDGSWVSPEMQEMDDKIKLISRQIKEGDYSGMDELYVQYLQRQYHNPFISKKTLNLSTRLNKYFDLEKHYETNASPEMKEAYKKAEAAAKRLKTGSDNNLQRQLWPALKPVAYDEAGMPLTETDKKNQDWNDGWIKAYASEDLSERIPYIDDMINEYLQYVERPELFDPEKMEENIEDVYRLSRLGTILKDNVLKNPINKAYFDSFTQEKKDYILKAFEYAGNKIYLNTIAQFEMGMENNFTYKDIPGGDYQSEKRNFESLKTVYETVYKTNEETLGDNAVDKTKNVASYKTKYIESEKAKRENNNKKVLDSLKLMNPQDKEAGKIDDDKSNPMDEATLLLLRTEVKDASTLPAGMRILLGLPATLPPGADKEEDTRKANEVITALRTVGDMMNEDELIEENGGEEFNVFRNMRYAAQGDDLGNAITFYNTIKSKPADFGFVPDDQAKEGDLKMSALEELGFFIKMYSYRFYNHNSYGVYLKYSNVKKLKNGTSGNPDFMKAYKTLNEMFDAVTPQQQNVNIVMNSVLMGLQKNITSNKNYIAADNDRIFRKSKESQDGIKTMEEMYNSTMKQLNELETYKRIMVPTGEDEEIVKNKIAAVNDKTSLTGSEHFNLFAGGKTVTKEDYERIKTVLDKSRMNKVPEEGTEEYKKYKKLLRVVSNEPEAIYGYLKNIELLELISSKEDVKNQLTDIMREKNEKNKQENTKMLQEHRDILNKALDELDSMLS